MEKNLSTNTEEFLGCWLSGSAYYTSAQFSVKIVEIALTHGMEIEKEVWDADVPKFLDGTADFDALEDLAQITDAAMDYLDSLLPEGYYFEFDDGLYLRKDDDTCNCPCGCEVPLAGGSCVDCADGDHQNNNNLDEYKWTPRV